MQSLTEKDNRAVLQKAIWLLIAVALNAVELAIPRLPFFPWLKPGFANIIAILWIIKFGFKDALLFTALRIWISGFYFGFSLFALSLSFSGGLLSVIAMSVMWMTLGKRGLTGTIGIAVIGALFHNAGQLAVVYLTMSRNMSMFGQIPFMLCASVLFGGIVGALAPVAARVVDVDIKKNIVDDNDKIQPKRVIGKSIKSIYKLIVAVTFAVSISIMFINNMYVLISAAIIFSSISWMLNPKKPSVIIYPIRFYMLFLFIAVTYLFFTYGTRIDLIPIITKEGLIAFAKQSLRLWCWLQTTHIFTKFGFHEIFMAAMRLFFPNKKDTLEAGMIALEHFPEIIRFAKSNKKISVAKLCFKPRIAMAEYINDITCRIAGVVEKDNNKNQNLFG
jgi:uncharacterized membrane protein